MKIKKYIYCLLLLIILAAAIPSCNKMNVPATPGSVKEYDSLAFDYFFVEAIKLKLMGNAGESLKFLEQCLRINPENSAAYYQMSQIVMANGDINNGKKYLKKAIDKEPGNLWYLMMLAGTYYQEQKLDSAIMYYEKAISNHPEKEDMKLTLANLYSEYKKYDKANEIYENLEKKYGINQSATVGAIKNLMWAQRYDEALDKALLLLKEYPDEILFNGLLAEIYSGRGDSDKAMEVYNKLLKRNPDNAETQLSLCDFLINEKKYGELFLLINTVILNDGISKEDKISLFARLIGTPELVEKNSAKLELSLMVLEAEYKNDGIIQLLRPEMLSQALKYNEAAIRLEEIIKEQPDNYYAWEKLILVYLDAGEYKKLEERAKECATKFNRSFHAKILYATGASENKNYETALEELRKADILAGEDKEMKMQVLSIRADVLYRMKDFEKAFQAFDEAIKADKEDITILNNYAYYLAEQNLRLKDAEVMAEQVIKTEKNNNTYLDTYGWVLYKRGKVKEAAKVFETIMNSNKEPDAEYFEHYGYILKKRRDCREAVINWESALKMDSTKTYLLREIENCGKAQ
jgi:tetratricopeptide (TPR) repeat protein